MFQFPKHEPQRLLATVRNAVRSHFAGSLSRHKGNEFHGCIGNIHP